MGIPSEIRSWLEGFAECVRQRDFNRGKTYFQRNVYGFGSYAAACKGIDQLANRQWKAIWPNITGFAFDLRQVHYKISADGRWACVMTPWRSTGYRSGRPFQRGGRVTILLTRLRRNSPWRAIHTHYSLNPGTPQTALRRR